MSTIKQLIKDMAEGQRALKAARKTGTLPKGGWGSILPDNVLNACIAAEKVQRNKVRITAALNVYHEMRGTGHVHHVSENTPFAWKYAADYKQLYEEFMSQGDDRCGPTPTEESLGSA